MNNYENLQKVLKEIFEMDKADLDFGIYRIMNQKREQVMDFIDRQLPKDIKKILSEAQSKDSVGIQSELDQMGKALDAAGVARESSPNYISLKQKLENAIDTNALEQEVFSHLGSFFKRYYKDGDFISLRRYKKDVYAIPYEGEEVKLYWANADQYYIKTSEYLKNYSFKLIDGKKVHFQLKEASTEQNNNKIQGDAERRFSIFEEQPVEVLNNELYINFTYEPHKKTVKQDDLTQKAFKMIRENSPAAFTLAFQKVPAERNKNQTHTQTVLEKHLNDFISRNSFDYFIHKDLGGFLNRELDFYIKNEVLFIDDINTENPVFFTAQLSKIKALKLVASKIINFLAQIENFQKKLWLKKKLVISTNYCITLDRIPEKYYTEIFENQAQLAEWKTLFGFDSAEATNGELSGAETLNSGVDALKNEPFLVLDTKFFTEEFKDKLLAEFDNLDEETNGLLINSENFQALNLIQEKYKEKVNGIYIDPPYNTGSDGFVYKDGFSHSSWLSMMSDRINLSNNLMSDSSGINVSINENELFNLKGLLDNHELTYFTTCDVRVRHENRILKGDKDFHEVTEQLLIYGKGHFKPGKRIVDNSSIENYKYEVVLKSDPDLIENYDGKEVQVFKPSSFEVKEVSPNENSLQKISIRGGLREGNSSGRYYVAFLENQFNTRRGFLFRVAGMGGDGLGYRYFLIPDELSNRKNADYFQGVPTNKSDFKLVPYPNFLDFERCFNNSTNEGGIEFRNGKKPIAFIKHIFKLLNLEKDAMVLDYFAGSGSTMHAAISKNRDSFNIKYIGIEVNTYFNTATKPRIQKVIYSDNWKNGKPQDKNGISHMFKYQVLESYEDTLNNLHVASKPADGLLNFSDEAKEEYLLKYMLDVESQEHLFNIEMFCNPFNYQLKVTENNELVSTKVDLVETFNYLIGLYVDRIQRVGDIKFVEGVTRTGVKTLVIWRNLETTNDETTAKRFRKIYDTVRSFEFDQIYINGDHHFDNYRTSDDKFKVKLIEETFFKKMFNISEL